MALIFIIFSHKISFSRLIFISYYSCILRVRGFFTELSYSLRGFENYRGEREMHGLVGDMYDEWYSVRRMWFANAVMLLCI